ncbi:hypothetical protein [Klebsiella michiganensis]|uniref:hypothetical protein n=1 Tax=Klebsiella michiganensis TaxID=1134687 RepID=UPI003F4FAB7D
MKFFKALDILIQEGYQQLYLKSWYALTTADIDDPSRWDSVAIYSGTEKLAWMVEHYDEWELSGYRPKASTVKQIAIPPCAIDLDDLNRMNLGFANW